MDHLPEGLRIRTGEDRIKVLIAPSPPFPGLYAERQRREEIVSMEKNHHIINDYLLHAFSVLKHNSFDIHCKLLYSN